MLHMLIETFQNIIRKHYHIENANNFHENISLPTHRWIVIFDRKTFIILLFIQYIGSRKASAQSKWPVIPSFYSGIGFLLSSIKYFPSLRTNFPRLSTARCRV